MINILKNIFYKKHNLEIDSLINSGKTSLKKLEELTIQLQLKDLILRECSDEFDHTEYKIENGIASGYPIVYFNNNIAIQMIKLPKHSKFTSHIHKNSKEIIIVTEGEFMLTKNNEDIFMTRQDVVEIAPNIMHTGYAITEVNLICISIPPVRGYPKC